MEESAQRSRPAIPQRVSVRFCREFGDEKSKVTGAFTFYSLLKEKKKLRPTCDLRPTTFRKRCIIIDAKRKNSKTECGLLVSGEQPPKSGNQEQEEVG